MKKIFKKLSTFNFQLSTSKGFTLIELLIVIVIIGVLASLLMANFVGIRERARDGQRKSDLRQIQSALEMYRSDQGSYPTSPLVNNCPVATPSFFGNAPTCDVTYMQKIPADPLGGSYQYNGSYCLRTCLENNNDSERDELASKYGNNNPSISACSGLTACSSGKSYTLQNP